MRILTSRLNAIYNDVKNKGFFHLLSANFLIQLVAFASQMFVAGILSPDDIGRVKIIQTFLSVFSIVAGMGFNASVLKLCSENRSKDEVVGIFRSALFFTVISTFTIYLIVLFLNYFKIFSSDLLISWLIPIGLFPLVSNSILMIFISYFQASMQIKLMSKITVLNKVVSIVAIILLSYFLGIKGYYLAYNLSFIIMIIVCYMVLKNDLPFKFTGLKFNSMMPLHWKIARPSLFANLFAEISAYIDILLINFLIFDMHEIGYYSFAVTLTIALRVFPSTVQQIAIPYFSSLAHNKTEFITVFKHYNRQLYLVVLITLILALILSMPIINFIFQGKYNAALPYFYLLAIGWSIRQLTQLQSGAIFGLGKVKFNVNISLISLIFNLIVYTIFIHFFGITGAAYSSILSGFFILILSKYYITKALT